MNRKKRIIVAAIHALAIVKAELYTHTKKEKELRRAVDSPEKTGIHYKKVEGEERWNNATK